MIDPVERATLFVLYHLSIVLGIVLLPVAVLARRLGVPIPLHRMIDRVEAAYAKR